jgi:LysR family transcriptional regulator, transcriptional activator of the cysJI operon
MELRHFKIFITVCKEKTMTRAAEVLYMTQPSVSQAIAELEKIYGVRLFERLGRRLYLTSAGEHFQIFANQILSLSEQMKKEMSDLRAGGSICIGASLTIGTYLLPGIITAYRQDMPQTEIFTRVANTGEIEKLILEDQVDIGLVEGPVYSPYILEEILSEDELSIICGPGHPLWGREKIDVSELAGMVFIVREPGSGTRDIFEQVMGSTGVSLKIGGIYNNNEAVKQAVRGNLGLAVVSRISIKDELERGLISIIQVQGLNLKRKFNLVYHRQKFFTHAIQIFIQTCKKTPLPGK